MIRADSITEIGLQRGMCYGPCPVYRVTLRRTGVSTFVGRHFVDLMGEYTAPMEASSFDALALAAADLGFERLARNYAIQVTDHATTTSWIASDRTRHEVEDYGSAGPDELHKFEDLIDAAASRLEWRPRTPPPTRESEPFA